jgi:hypothetical protein
VPRPQPNPLPGTPPLYFKIGVEYYVAGRAAWHHNHFQIAGNLFHHAVEMMLKAVLMQKSVYTAQQLKDKFRHGIRRLWNETTRQVPFDWSRFDIFVTDLDKWEKIRYGEFPEGKPKNLRIDALRIVRSLPGKPGHDEYRLCLEDADELFVVLARELGMGHSSFVHDILIGPEALDDYERSNQHVIR